ncbi:DUF3221 domain-containing protein [Paenibacillus sp. MER 99-2]|uniref:DUF3221 domain-containing protein n=1 Tax=Paenibacillus sp. MER 99-2 TaxID=2939572 RepID=UPI00203E78C7|nr:DUF3221 domain-containing protein [Paenibacillus sp. MER 99-2]MCM3172348.1 YobA family protein [Paenibacillus sp. MER 99-2]
MAKLVSGLTVVLLLVLTVGCSFQHEQTQSHADIIGTIIEVNEQDNQILIEHDDVKGSATNLIWISLDQDSEIIVGGVAKSKLNNLLISKKVEVWIKDLIAQSSPPQALANKVIIQ